MRSLLRASVLSFALAPAAAGTISLQDCVPGTPSPGARLPIGAPGDDGFAYRDVLYQFLQSTQPADVSYPPGWWPAVTAFSQNTALLPNSAPIAMQRLHLRLWSRDAERGPAAGAGQRLRGPLRGGLEPVLPSATGEVVRLEQGLLMTVKQEFVADLWKRFLFDPGIFELGYIEDVARCEARIPAFHDDSTMTWLMQWDYPGNIFRLVPDVTLRRYATYLALQLIQLDWAIWQGGAWTAQSPMVLGYPPLGTPPANGEVFVHPGPVNANNYHSGAGTITADDLGDRLVMLSRIHAWVMQAQPAWLTPGLNAAFQEGLARSGERLARMNVLGGQANRYLQAIHALAGVKASLAGSPWQAAATAWHDQTITRFLNVFRDAGYFGDDDGRYDAAYNRYNLVHLVRSLVQDPGTSFTNVIRLVDQARKLGNLEAHLTFTDRTGIHTSPSGMSVRTGAGVAGRSRRVAAAPDFALNLLAGHAFGVPYAYARARDLSHVGPFDSGLFAGRVDARSSNPDYVAELACYSHPNHDPFPWLPQLAPLPLASQTLDALSGAYRQYGRPVHAVEELAPGTLAAFADSIDQNRSSALLPFEEPGPYLADFDGEFVFAKFGGSGVYFEGDPSGTSFDEYQPASARDYAAVVHLGPVSPNHSVPPCGESNPRGYGGGQLATVWAPGGGLFSMTRRKGYNNDCESWQGGEWTTLPLHHVALVDTASRVATSARIALPATFTAFTAGALPPAADRDFLDVGAPGIASLATLPAAQADHAFLEAAGPFSDQRYPTNGQLVQAVATPVDYVRRFILGEGGITVRTELRARMSTIMPTERSGKQVKQEEYPQPMPKVFQAWEILPLGTAEGPTATGHVATDIALITAQGAEVAVPGPALASEAVAYRDIKAVIVTREAGTLTIEFAAPQTIAFSNDFTAFGGDTPSRNIMIDLTPTKVSSANVQAALPQAEQLQPVVVEYTVRASM
ncbi:MAG: hypothetical protein R3F60_29510 [bacterium]